MILLLLMLALAAPAQETVRVASRAAERKLPLPGEIRPFEAVNIEAGVPGFIETIAVDKGSLVRKGQTLVELSAPEMQARIAEAEARRETALARQAESEARAAALEATLQRLRKAAETPGAIAENEISVAQKTLDAEKAAVAAAARAAAAHRAESATLRDLQSYLTVKAPFSGVITERLAHPGALAGPGNVLLRLENHAQLRLIAAVPEAHAAAVAPGARVEFTVPAYPGQTFAGTVARNPGALDPATRTLGVELDVANPARTLAPGMYPEVLWPVRKSGSFVPVSSVVTTTERVFVIRVAGGKAEWVDVRKGPVSGDLVEVTGRLAAGDEILKRGTDEIRPGTPIRK